MSNILFILAALLVLTVIITIHEFGHFLVGRAMGIGIVEFSVGMGPKIVSRVHKGIRYSLRWIPLGGFCSFVGEDGNNPDPHAMNNQPVWKRFLTVLAGPAFNFLIAILISVGLISGGLILNPYEVDNAVYIGSVVQGQPAEQAGILPGDRIEAIDGVSLPEDDPATAEDETIAFVQNAIRSAAPGASVDITVLREGEEVTLALQPVFVEEENRMMIGVTFGHGLYKEYDCNVITAIPESFKLISKTVVATLDFIGDTISGLLHGRGVQDGAVTGAVGIVSTMSTDLREGFNDAFSSGIYTVLYWIFVISLNLGIINLLPLPALDGGRLALLLVEGIRRKPLNREREGMIHLIGFAFLIILMVLITYSDITHLVK